MTTQARIHEQTIHDDFDHIKTPEPPIPATSTSTEQTLNSIHTTTGFTQPLLWLGGSSLLGFAFIDMLNFYEQNITDYPIITLVVISLTLAFVGLLLLIIRQELRHYQQLRSVEQQSSQLQSALQQENKPHLIKLLKQRTPTQASGLAAQLHKRFWHSVQAHHTAKDVWQLYEQMVLSPLNEQAQAHIQQATLQGSAISLLSPNDLIHTLVLLWRSMKLVKELALIYGIRPGIYGNWHLLRLSLKHALIQQGSDLVLEASLKQLSEHFLAKVAEKGAQAATTGFLVRRLGLAAMALLTIDEFD